MHLVSRLASRTSAVLAALIAVVLFYPSFAPAREAARPPEAASVQDIRITGNKALTTEEIRSIMLTGPRSSFLGTGLFPGAKRPFNQDDFEKDIALIRKLYAFKGYFYAGVDTSVVRKNSGRRLRININIRENAPSLIDSISYSGIESVPDSIRENYLNQSRLRLHELFSVEKLIAERDRTLEYFREYGYSLFHPDSIRIRVDTVDLKAGVHFRMNLPERLTYGPVRAVVHDPRKKDDESRKVSFEKDGISVTVYGKQKFAENLFPYAIAFRPGQQTRLSLEQRTLQNFGSTNIFSSIAITSDSIKAGRQFTTVNLDAAPKHQIEPKLLMDNRYGALFVGAELGYENKNLFGAGEQLALSANYGSQTTVSKDVLQNLNESDYDKVLPFELSLKANLVMPVIKKQGSYYSASAEYSRADLPVLLSTRRELVRGSYSTSPTKRSRLDFDFFELELVQKDSLRGFAKLFRTDLAENIGIDPNNDEEVNNGIDSLLNTRITQTFRLQYNYSNREDALPVNKTVWNLMTTAEESGSLFWLIDEYIDRKSYAGFTDSDPQIFGTSYSQYLKLDNQVSFAKNLTPDRQLAGRLSVGWMTPYGKAETTPDERRFYAGGPNSLRGWLFNTLGPGSSKSEAASNFGADIKLELGMEYRMKLFKLFGQPSGITLFSDIGNIWDRKGEYALSLRSLAEDFAWDWGAGLRIGSPIGPFRFDFAWKIHDPTDPDRWQISKWSPGDFTFNFGIGETF